MTNLNLRIFLNCLLIAFVLPVAFATGSETLADLNLLNTDIQRTETKLVVNSTLDVESLRKMKSDREVWLTPVVISNDGKDSIEIAPLCLAGHNRYNILKRTYDSSADRDAVLRASKFAELPVSFTTDFEPWMENSRIVFRTRECGCCNAPITYGTLEGPYLDFRPRFLEAQWAYIQPPAEVKTRTLSGSAYIDFPVNRTELYPDYRRNPEELKSIRATIDVVRDDPDVHIDSLSVIGYASPEGPWANNVRLAAGRTATLIEYIRKLYDFPQSILHKGSVPEDWAGLVKHLELTDIANRDPIMAIASNESIEPDMRNEKIKREFPIQYDWILKNIYPALRHSDYTVHYTVVDYTDPTVIGELLKSNPQKLSLEEMFTYANTLDADSDEFREVFEIAVRMYPDNPIANLNAANTALRHGEIDVAERYLDKSGNSTEATYLRGVAAVLRQDYTTAFPLLTKAASLGSTQAEDALKQIKEKSLDKDPNFISE